MPLTKATLLCLLVLTAAHAAEPPAPPPVNNRNSLIEAPAAPEKGFHFPYVIFIPESAEGKPRRQLIISDLYGGPSFPTQRFCLGEIFCSVRVWTKIEQHCLAIIDSKNSKVIKRQRAEQKQCANQKLCVGKFCQPHRLSRDRTVHFFYDAAPLP